MLEELKRQVCEANLELVKRGVDAFHQRDECPVAEKQIKICFYGFVFLKGVKFFA